MSKIKSVNEIWCCKTVEWVYLSIMSWNADEELIIILEYLHKKDKLKSITNEKRLREIFDKDNKDVNDEKRKRVLEIIKEEFFDSEHPKIRKITLEDFDILVLYLLWKNKDNNQLSQDDIICSIKKQSIEIVWGWIEKDKKDLNHFWDFLKSVVNKEEKKYFFEVFLESQAISINDKVDFLINNRFEYLDRSLMQKINEDVLKSTFISKWLSNNLPHQTFSSIIYDFFNSISDIKIKSGIIKTHKKATTGHFIIRFLEENDLDDLSDEDKIEILEHIFINDWISWELIQKIYDSMQIEENKLNVSGMIDWYYRKKRLSFKLKEWIYWIWSSILKKFK